MFNEYVLNLRPPGRQRDLVAGAAFAAGLEAAYLAYFVGEKSHQEALAHAYKAFAESWSDFPKDDPNPDKRSPKSFDRMFQAICSYFEFYPFETDRVRPMLLQEGKPSYEFSFAVPLDDPIFPRHPVTGDPFLYGGRFDAFGKIDDTLVVRDEKTTGHYLGFTWSEQWSFRNQFIGYTWAATKSGYPCNTAVVRGIQILKRSFDHAEAVKVFGPHIYRIFETQLARDLHRMIGCWTQGWWDYDIGDACTSFNRPCNFLDLCTSANPSAWFGQFEHVKWSPLTRTLEDLSGESND